jgi:hypothetical protein
MLWILVAFILFIAVIVSPTARKVMVRLLGIGVVVTVLLYAYIDTERRTRERQELAARQRRPHSVELSDLQVEMKQFGKLTGRVKNHDQRSTLTRIELLVRIRDCEYGECEIVGETREDIAVEIPPGQVRDIAATTYFRDLGPPPRFGRQWSCFIESVSRRPQGE